MKSLWPTVALGDHVTLLTGFPFKSTSYTEDSNSVRLLRGDNVAQGFLRWENAKRWPNADVQNYKDYELAEGDVILAMDRPWIEAGLKYAWIGKRDIPSYLVQRVARLRGTNGLITEYLRYVIADPSFSDYIRPIVTGVTVPHISGDQIRAYRFQLPPLQTQRKIADILSAYDDLIENNTRRVKILEEMAQTIYREWFVHFRFPGHEQVAMVETELGLVPDGWQRVALGQIAEINARSIRGSVAPDVIRYVDISSVSRGQIDNVTDMPFDQAPGRARRILRHGDTIWSCVRPNRRSYSPIITPTEDMIASTGFAVISPVSVPYTFLYQSVTTDEFVAYLTNHARGAAYPAVTAEDFEHAVVHLPDPVLTHQYHAIVEPMSLLKHSLQERNSKLRQTRDLLLPKLVSGEVKVDQERLL